jgi:hypothetical protein
MLEHCEPGPGSLPRVAAGVSVYAGAVAAVNAATAEIAANLCTKLHIFGVGSSHGGDDSCCEVKLPPLYLGTSPGSYPPCTNIPKPNIDKLSKKSQTVTVYYFSHSVLYQFKSEVGRKNCPNPYVNYLVF